MCLTNLAFLLYVQMPLKGYSRSTQGTTESLFLKKDFKKKIENKVISLLRVQMEIKNIWRNFSLP